MSQQKQIDSQTQTIRLPLDRNHKEDVFVAVNGQTYLIQRGHEVTVPVAVVQVLKNKEAMLQTALNYEQAVTAKQ